MSYEERDLLEQMVQERDYELKSLKEVTTKQELQIKQLSQELNTLKVENTKIQSQNKTNLKEIQLSNDLLQKRLIASIDTKLPNNEKVAMLKHNLQLGSIINKGGGNVSIDVNGTIKTLQSNLTKTVRHICTLEKQLEIMKEESTKHMKSMKHEINECREERSREEILLLNQLSTLDREKNIIEDELRRKISNQKDVIDKLHEEMDVLKDKAKNIAMVSPTSVLDAHHTFDNDTSSSPRSQAKRCTATISELSDDDNDDEMVLSGPPMEAFKDSHSVILEQLANITREKDCMEQDLRHELRIQRETITQLEQSQTKHLATIEQLQQLLSQKDEELQSIRCKIEEELKQTIQFIMEGQQESLLNLERVAALHKKTDESINVIKELITPFEEALLSKPPSQNDENVQDIITYYTTALLKTKLLHEEMKASLSYIEIQLKFQQSSLQAISNNESQNMPQPDDNNNNNILYLQTKVKNMQENILNSIRTLERTYKQKYTQLQEDFQQQYQSSLNEIHTKQTTIQTLETTITSLTQNTNTLQQQLESKKQNEEANNKYRQQSITLQNKLKAKEQLINSLNMELNESNVRYDVLKDEFKKMKQRVKLMEVDDMLSCLERDVSISYSDSMPEE